METDLKDPKAGSHETNESALEIYFLHVYMIFTREPPYVTDCECEHPCVCVLHAVNMNLPVFVYCRL